MNKETENTMKKVTINNFLKQISKIGDDWQFPKKYIITEDFPVNGKRTYEIYNLTFEQEDGIIIFDDAEGLLLETMPNVLAAFLRKSVLEVRQAINEKDFILRTLLKFKDGSINIDVVREQGCSFCL